MDWKRNSYVFSTAFESVTYVGYLREKRIRLLVIATELLGQFLLSLLPWGVTRSFVYHDVDYDR